MDVLCTDAAYRRLYAEAGLEVVADCRPLGRGDDGVSETEVAPWVMSFASERSEGNTPDSPRPDRKSKPPAYPDEAGLKR